MATHENYKKMPMKKHMMPAKHKAMMGAPMPQKKSAKPKAKKKR